MAAKKQRKLLRELVDLARRQRALDKRKEREGFDPRPMARCLRCGAVVAKYADEATWKARSGDDLSTHLMSCPGAPTG